MVIKRVRQIGFVVGAALLAPLALMLLLLGPQVERDDPTDGHHISDYDPPVLTLAK